jgi:hypothetical protein
VPNRASTAAGDRRPIATVEPARQRDRRGHPAGAYRSGAFSTHELAVAAARLSEEMPIPNGEYEWIAISLADLD